MILHFYHIGFVEFLIYVRHGTESNQNWMTIAKEGLLGGGKQVRGGACTGISKGEGKRKVYAGRDCSKGEDEEAIPTAFKGLQNLVQCENLEGRQRSKARKVQAMSGSSRRGRAGWKFPMG